MLKCNFRFFGYIGFLVFHLAGYAAFSQPPANAAVIDKFNEYNDRVIQEKLFLHTDKEFYVAGEIAWFRIYYVDGSSHRPLQVSKLAYVEVLNEKSEPLLQAKVSLQPGECNGSFYLPTTLLTGNYIIRAYTNWMKNFDASCFFQKRITIVNTLRRPEPAASMDSAEIAVSFFPESGHLVAGIQSKIGFRATDARGSGINFHGYILDQNSDTVVSFVPLKFGIGNFTFRPVPGYRYKAMIVLPGGSVISKPLPGISDHGYVMRVAGNSQDQVIVTVHKRNKPGEQGVEQVLLAAHTRQMLQVAEKAFISSNDSVVFIIDKKRMGKGVTHFTLFNKEDQPVCERLFYTKPPAGIALQVASDQNSYTTRQRISLGIQSGTVSNAPLSLSASVFYMDSLQADPSTIVDYMWLVSDLAGNIESPGYYFSNDPDVAMATDNLMLTHGWRRFRWTDVLDSRNSLIKYLPEVNGHLVTGKVTDIRTGNPVSNVNTYLSIPGNPFGFYTSRSDANGLVFYEVKKYYGNGAVIAQPAAESDSFYRVEILNPYFQFAEKKYPSYRLTENIREQLLRKSIGMQVQNVYAGDSLRNFYAPALTDTLPFYGKGEHTYRLDEYKRFTTMEEVLREYVMEIGVGARNGKLAFKIFNPMEHDFYEGNSLVLIDGVAITDPNKIFSYDPLKIRKLDVIRSRYVVGQSVFNGIASFSTYEGGFDGFDLNTRLVAIDYGGLQLQREFYSPVYETREQLESRLPDFRNTLFWQPDIGTDREGKAALQFYSSDQPGKYMVIVQGMSESGDFVFAGTSFEVK